MASGCQLGERYYRREFEVDDIEIYIREPVLKKLLGWLKSRLGPLQELGPGQPGAGRSKGARVYTTLEWQPPIPIHIQAGIEGGPYTCLWFKSAHTPWRTDAECAREVFAALGVPVQCDPGQEYEHQDDFLRIDGSGERVVRLSGGRLGSQ